MDDVSLPQLLRSYLTASLKLTQAVRKRWPHGATVRLPTGYWAETGKVLGYLATEPDAVLVTVGDSGRQVYLSASQLLAAERPEVTR